MKTIYYNGDIITMECKKDHPESVVIEDGKIIYVGNKAEAEKKYLNLDKKIDLCGKTLMPSFIDPHGHVSMVAQFSGFCDLSQCSSFDEVISTLKKFKEDKNIQEDGVIIGNAYDHNFLKENKHPNKNVLDKVSSTIPIVIFHTSIHMAVANTALLNMCGFNKDTKNPEGGVFGRDEEGELTGYVEEAAMAQIIGGVAPLMKMDFIEQMKLAQNIYLSNGITTVQDGASGYDTMKELSSIADRKLLNIDINAYVMVDDFHRTVNDFEKYYKKYNNRLKIAGAKIVLDGSPQGKSAWLSKPYEGETEYKGYAAHSKEYVLNAMQQAIRGNYQILAHCNGDAASGQFIECYKEAYDKEMSLKKHAENIKDLRPVMIHCQTVREDQLDEMVKLHMIPSIFVAHTYYWGDVHLKNLGPIRGANISPVKWALEKGLIYNFHQDSPVVRPDVLHTVWCAVNRITRQGQLIGNNQCIDVYDALKGVTIHAAYEYHEENIKGTIKEGKNADLVILDQNPIKVNKTIIKDIKVLETIKDGTIVYKR